jgi:hypothetical protein
MPIDYYISDGEVRRHPPESAGIMRILTRHQAETATACR